MFDDDSAEDGACLGDRQFGLCLLAVELDFNRTLLFAGIAGHCHDHLRRAGLAGLR